MATKKKDGVSTKPKEVELPIKPVEVDENQMDIFDFDEIFPKEEQNTPNLAQNKPVEAQKEENRPIPQMKAKVARTRINLRKTNSSNSAILCQIPSGYKMFVLEEEGIWSKIKYNHLTGYVVTNELK